MPGAGVREREFGRAGDGVAQIMAILEWIHRNVDYVAGVSNAETSAERTFVDRAGVCRDFTHLGITLARALGTPTRAVSAYALQLNPPTSTPSSKSTLKTAGGSSILHGSLQSKVSSG